MRYLGIDHGLKRIGVAVSDAEGLVARPLQIVSHKSRAADAERLAEIVVTQKAEKIIVGLPTGPDGEITHQARTVMRFVAALGKEIQAPIEYWDETNSSVRAAEIAASKRKRAKDESLDSIAAAVILQDYIDAHSPRQAQNLD